LILQHDGLKALTTALQSFSFDEKLVAMAMCLVGTLFMTAKGMPM
jgi:hypothetical protein